MTDPADQPATLEDFDGIAPAMQSLRQTLSSVIVGQTDTIELLLAALLCRAHVLIVGVPGLAKTLLVRTLASAVGLQFGRIQFTPDLMPADILGTELIQENERGERHLKFVPGPVFAQLILADEINRTPPKTQSALLEAMAERQVTVSGRSMKLDEPFVVVATQNPIEQEGTYPLPEAQLDRFMFGLKVDYPTLEQEVSVVGRTPDIAAASARIEPVVDRAQLMRFSDAVWRMPVTGLVVDYAVRLARATRPGDPEAPETVSRHVGWGAGPRAGQALVHAAKALAAMQGEPTPTPEHIRHVAPAVLRHRVLTNFAAAGEGVGIDQILSQVIERVQWQ
ncbi:MAG: MoxR family ATPase [Planctomycetota bacterium]